MGRPLASKETPSSVNVRTCMAEDGFATRLVLVPPGGEPGPRVQGGVADFAVEIFKAR